MLSLYALLAGLAAFVVYKITTVGRRDKRLPPGPPTLPVIGNLHQIPTKRTHLKFVEWAKQYGGIFSLKMGPGTVVVLTSPRLIKELLDKKSSIYNYRPPSYVGNGIIANGDHLLLMQYSDRWRMRRKLAHQFFMEQMVTKQHIAVVNAEAIQLVRDMFTQPEKHMTHPKRFSNSIIMSLVYGSRTPTAEYSHFKDLYAIMENFTKLMEPGNTPPVDEFQFLKFVPERLFGMWRSRAQDVSDEMNKLYAKWADHILERRKNSGARDCFMDRALDQGEKYELDRHALNFLGGTLMEGGSDTTSTVLLTFIHALTRWPEVQRKAQAQIDAVIGEERSPTWDDHSKLPYVAACVKEAMRWRPVTPLGIPHALAEDDWVDGMWLPKGSTIFINVFGLHHDPERFANPDTFDPDHFKGITALAPELANGDWEKRDHYGYGAGRRLCPGIHLAERSLFVAIAKMLWGLYIEAPEGVEPDVSNERAYSAGTISCAEPYGCKVRPRSAKRRETILREFERADVEVFSLYETPDA